MSRFRVSNRAKEDLAEIWLYIAADNPRAADRLAGRFLEKYESLADNPGRIRPEGVPKCPV